MHPALTRFRALPLEEQERVVMCLPEDERHEFLDGLELLKRELERNYLTTLYPGDGPFRRSLYPKQMELYDLGATYQFRAFLGGNGTGKTLGAGIEVVYHLTGLYPEWWTGWRWNRAITALAAGDTKETVRDIIQAKMMGADENGTGLLPAHLIGKIMLRQNGNGSIDFVKVKHVSDKWSTLYFKSYDQGRKTFQGQERDLIWLDEECPMDVFQECIFRFRGKCADGRLLLTFTPLNGVTEVVKLFVPQFSAPDDDDEEAVDQISEQARRAVEGSRAFVMCSWEDIPHLSDALRNRYLANVMSYEREARMRGIPTAGRGRVFTVEEEAFVVNPFRIPKHWPRIYGADFGFGKVKDKSGTGVIWGAWDQSTDTVYLYDEYRRAEAPPSVHAVAIKSRGEWIQGVGDYAGGNAMEGEKVIDIYKELGLLIINANKGVYDGLHLMTEMLNEGRFRVFATCQKWLEEYRLYSLDDKNRVIKSRDHLLDASRYLVMADRTRARTQPISKGKAPHKPETFGLY